MPVKKGLSKGAKIGIAAAGILTLGAVAALTVWGVKSKDNKEPEGTEPNIKGPNNEEQNIESNENGSEKEKDIVNTSKNKEKKQNIIIENKNGNEPEGNIIMEEKIVEKKQEQSKFFNVLQKTFDSENNKFVYQKIKVITLNMGIKNVFLPWLPADIFKKMFEAIANKNSGFLECYRFNKKENNDECKKLIDMISGNIEFDDIQVEEIAEGFGLKKYCLTICKESMKEWMKFTISNANFLNNYDSIANIEIQLCERLDKKGKVIKKCECISIDSLMNEGKFKGISED